MKLLSVQYENIVSIEDDTPKQETSPLDLTKERVMTDYLDVFGEELGCMKGKVHLEIDPNVTSAVMPPRRVRVALKEKLKTKLDCLTQRQAISQVEDPTDYM